MVNWIEERYKEKITVLPLALQEKYGEKPVKIIIDCNTMLGEKVGTTNIVGVYPVDKNISRIVFNKNARYNRHIIECQGGVQNEWRNKKWSTIWL